MNHDKTHNVLGRWCWTCGVKTESGLPGWPKPHRGPQVKREAWDINEETGQGDTESIIWANGDVHRAKDQRVCAICGRYCKHPVERTFLTSLDHYKELTSPTQQNRLLDDYDVTQTVSRSMSLDIFARRNVD